MIARVKSTTVLGIDGYPLDVEVDNFHGKQEVAVVGLPDPAVKESKDRVTSAVQNSGYRWPAGKVVVSLAPADLRKEGSALDLPIALGVLGASGQNEATRIDDYALVGELALDGSVRPIAGALCMTLAARKAGLQGLLVPRANAPEAGVVPGVDVIPVDSLREAAAFMAGEVDIVPHRTDIDSVMGGRNNHQLDLSDVKGQAHVKRALIVAASGGHNILLIGPPGTGKTMLAQRLPGLLPDLSFEEALETTQVYSVSGVREDKALIVERPFRKPHHTASTVSITGGGAGPRPNPGEISLAHHGVLFLDELPEFNRAALEALRQPLEDGVVHIRRAMYSVTYPSRFMLVVAMNPCPCGYRSDRRKECRCSLGDIQRYVNRLSGPLMDRIDIHVEVPGLSFEEMADGRASGPTSAEARAVVIEARARQRDRAGTGATCNAYLNGKDLQAHCRLSTGASTLLQNAMDQLGLSARAYDKVLRVARTIADLDEADSISEAHIAEAIQYRSLDRTLV